MKTTSFYKFIAGATLVLVTLFVVNGCTKNELQLSDNINPAGGSYFKLNWMSPAITTQGVRLKINNEILSGPLGLGAAFTSTTQYAMPFPGGGLNTGGNNKNDYLSVPAGSFTVSLVITKAGTNIDSIVVLAPVNMTIDPDAFASLVVTDSFPAATSYTLDDNVQYADSGYFKLKLTNAIPNAGPIDFLVTNTRVTDSLIATGIDYKKATAFLNLPFVAGAVTVKYRKPGTTAILNAVYSTSSMTNKRVFTGVARGYVGATGTRAPNISFIFNK
jgi:hypothetical protein